MYLFPSLFAAVNFALIIFLIVNSIRFLQLIFLIIFLGAFISLMWRQTKYHKCKIVDKLEINGTRVYVCDADFMNAWYDLRRKTSYITKSFYEILNSDELKAIIIHEIGHGRNRIMIYLTNIMYALWLCGLASAFTMLVLAFFIKSVKAEFSLLVWLLFVSVPTLITIIISWISEHEADMESFRKVGVAPLINALIKSNVLSKYRLFIKQMEFNDIDKLTVNTKFIELLKLFLKYSLIDSPKDVVTFILKPTYPTHPPVILRFIKASLSIG